MEHYNDMKMKLQSLVENLDLIEDELSRWINPTNIFSILKLSRNEIRHSNFLSYLFDPKGSHGYDDNFLKDFLKLCVTDESNEVSKISFFDVALSDYNDMVIYREKAHIDLLFVSEKNKLVVCIENKIDASESTFQLKKYQYYIETTYQGYNHLFVFLTPNGIEPTKKEWKIVSYLDILKILERRQSLKRIETKVDILINDYIDMLRRDILMDEELQKICQRIYTEHKDALDLIFENRPDNLSIMSELYIEALTELAKEDKVVFDPSFSGKALVRFESKELSKAFPKLPGNVSGGWNNYKPYAFEINNKSEQSSGRIKLAFTGDVDSDRREDLEEFFRKLGYKTLKTNWKWKSIGNWKIKLVNSKFIEDLSLEEESKEKLVKDLKISIEKTLKQIDKDVLEYIELKNK
ncbi:PD-(D/E)XK nuclease family protein [Vagococcus lutrae]|uniref:PDDEXK-like family protein n=1 Tax=Vagococcus lutrae TaxID=81947 RepID=UPI001FEB8E6E|nr:PD-(D/E)XK nuclease family protein [Vagococcus lutrae]